MTFIRGTGLTIKKKAWECISRHKAVFTKATGKQVKPMARVLTSKVMVMFMKETT